MISNEHIVTYNSKQRVKDLTRAGTPKYLIAKILGISDETLNHHYDYELATAKTEAIESVSNKVMQQALDGDPKAQALYLKTQGASQGWVEKQIIETTDTKDTQALHDKIAELERVNTKDY